VTTLYIVLESHMCIFTNHNKHDRYACNAAHLALQVAAMGHRKDECESFAEQQVNYALGDGGRSYMVGFGNNPPQQPHHRAASCPDVPQPCDWNNYNSNSPNPQASSVFGPKRCRRYACCRYIWLGLSRLIQSFIRFYNVQILNGALVGGPGPNDDYNDSRSDFQVNRSAKRCFIMLQLNVTFLYEIISLCSTTKWPPTTIPVRVQ
jgi:endoglucanase